MLYRLSILLTLAEGLPPESSPLTKDTVLVLGGILGLLTIYILILTAIATHRKVFGRTPPLEVELGGKADKHNVDRLEVDIKGFVRTQELEDHKEAMRLRTLGLEKQISDARHDFAGQMQAISDSVRNRDEEASAQFTEMQRQLRESDKLLAKLEERSRNVEGTINNFDRKLDRLNAGRTSV